MEVSYDEKKCHCCGQGLVLLKDKIISPNGEIKPGVCSNGIYEGFIMKE